MHPFQGELLIGGARLRNVCGELEDRVEPWSGRFAVESSRGRQLEIQRNYLLVLDDGRTQKVVVTRIERPDEEAQDGWIVEFQACCRGTSAIQAAGLAPPSESAR